MGLLLVIVLLVGCGKSATENKEAAETKSASTSQTKETKEVKGEETKEPVTLKFTYWGSPVEKQAMEKNLQMFEEKYDNIKVDSMYIPNADYLAKISAMVAGNETPDVAYLFEGNALAWAEEGIIKNINGLLDGDPDLNKEDFLEDIWYNYGEGKTLGTNTACEALGIFYNKGLITKAGITVPSTAEEAWTWDEFVDAAKELTIDEAGRNAKDPNFDPEAISQYGIQFGTWWAHYMAMVYSNGGDLLNEDGTEFALNEPEAVEAIQKLADLINVHHVAPSPAQVKSMPSPVVSLQSEQVAMIIDGQWNLLDLGQAAETGFEFGIGVLPKLKESVTIVLGAPTVIFESTKYPEESWLLFKWLANPESGLQLHKDGLWMPLMKDWYQKPELIAKWAENNPAHPSEYKTAIMEQTMKNGVPGPVYYAKGFAEIDAIVSPALEEVWFGLKSAEEALNGIEEQVEKALQGRYDR